MFCLGKRSKLFRCHVRLSPHITECRLDRWKDLIEYRVWVTGNF